ncbi:unnamed protein product [Meloidogyne enterolobii]|uniref:Uncharacterized protein n=1 Tax=Meloidogyne enterolobii TaxID=390850 RepID=A0ACB0ZSH0_MELEN
MEAGSSSETGKLGKMIDLVLNDYWGNICAIDRDNVQFEKADEWILQTGNLIKFYKLFLKIIYLIVIIVTFTL